MILTGARIASEVAAGRITIQPFDAARLEPNSYGFSLGRELLIYSAGVLDPTRRPAARRIVLPAEGRVLLPDRLYLGHTSEILGSPYYAATLYACRSSATLGVWITFSAPLGHTGAVLAWTLEIRVAHPVLLHPGMRIGKIAFWLPQGTLDAYAGKYTDSRGAVSSRLSDEDTPEHRSVPA
jgi:dCTP deaminase